MKNKIILFLLSVFSLDATAQDSWKISAEKIDPSKYFSITAANGIIGIVSSPQPFKVKNVF